MCRHSNYASLFSPATILRFPGVHNREGGETSRVGCAHMFRTEFDRFAGGTGYERMAFARPLFSDRSSR